MHSETATYFMLKLPTVSSAFPKLSFLFIFFCPLVPPSTSPSLPSETDWHFVDVITDRHYSLLSTSSHSTQISTILPTYSLYVSNIQSPHGIQVFLGT